MKKFILHILILVVLSFAACDEATIELDPIGDTEAGFFQNEEQMSMAVAGIYQKMNFFYAFRANAPIEGVWLLPSDDLTTPGGHAFEHFVALNGSNGQLDAFYRYAYQLIARANIVLQKIEENGDFAYELNPDLRDYHKGEALFLRSWMYYILWNTFGTAPLVTERIVDLNDAYPPNSQGTELLDQAIIDLEEAASLLPDAEAWGAEAGHATRNSALGLRAKILVFRGSVNQSNADFTAAIANIDAISGVSLMPHYNDNFDALQENNAESLFEYQSNDQPAFINSFLNNDDFATVGEIAHYLGIFTRQPGWVGNNVYMATESLKNAYEAGDPRAQYVFDADVVDDVNVVKYVRSGIQCKGWAAGYGQNRNNARILRYADVLLLKAEAIVRSGGTTSEAIGLINQIRERARNSVPDTVPVSIVPADLDVNETDEATVLDWIFNERRLELACEQGHRWYDLRRRHMIGEIDLKTWDFSSMRIDLEFNDYNVNFPIPELEVIENENMSQNEGY